MRWVMRRMSGLADFGAEYHTLERLLCGEITESVHNDDVQFDS